MGIFSLKKAEQSQNGSSEQLEELKQLATGDKNGKKPKPVVPTPQDISIEKGESISPTTKKEAQNLSAFEKLKSLSTAEDTTPSFSPATITTTDKEGFSWLKAGFPLKEISSKEETSKVPLLPNSISLPKVDFPTAKVLGKQVYSPGTEPSATAEAINQKFSWELEDSIDEPFAKDFGEPSGLSDKPKWDIAKESESEKVEAAKTAANAISTPIDKMFEVLTSYHKVDTEEIAKYSGLDAAIVEKIAKMFENEGIVELQYIVSLSKKPMVILKKDIESRIKEGPAGSTLESYKIVVDFVPANISIIADPEEARPVYTITTPDLGKYTRKFLNIVKNNVAETMPVEIEEIVDPKKAKELKTRFFEELNSKLAEYFPGSPLELLNMLSGVVLHEMYGLGDIELLMGDDMLEEVAINSAKTPITIYHRIHGWLKTNLLPGTEEDILNYASQIGRKVSREITVLSPILDAHLLSGDRVNATLFPVSSEGNTLTIRRFARRPWTLIDFIGRAHTMNSEMAALLWLAMQFELNVLVSGGTASGKTSTLNTLLALVPSYHRIISIEDVREIILPKYLNWNWIPLVTRAANPEGLGEVTMLDLMLSSLRMRPDRIIVGEIRRKKEAEVLMEAIETGHSIYSTVHANSAYQVLRRLAEPPMSIPLMQIELIDLIVTQYRDRKSNKRRTYEIAEIEQTSSGQGLQVSTVYKWSPRTDSWEQLNKPIKILTILNLHTGLTEEEIYQELEDRRVVLEWMRNNNINSLDLVGFVAKLYYSDPQRVKNMAKQNISFKEISGMLT